jgi:hypothetical protein
MHQELAGLELILYAQYGTGKMCLFALVRIMEDCSLHDEVLLTESM